MSRQLVNAIFFAVLPALLVQVYASFAQIGSRLQHDEAEHLHVVYAMERGERPYLDFIENHPTLFHSGVLLIKKIFGIDSAYNLYFAAKVTVYLGFAGCLVILLLFIRHYDFRTKLAARPAALMTVAINLFTPWAYPNHSLWELRPDWICFFFALLSIFCHYRFHIKALSGNPRSGYAQLIWGGIAGGLATAILAKSIYVIFPYVLILVVFLWSWVQEEHNTGPMGIKLLMRANGLFLFVGLFAYFTMVAIDVQLSGTTYGAYYKANFLLNTASKHLALTAVEKNPFGYFRDLTGMNFAFMLIFAAMVARKIFAASRSNLKFNFHVLLLMVMVIGFNCAFPAYTSGVIFPHYFIPSLLATIFLCVLLVSDVLNFSIQGLLGTMTLRIWGKHRIIPRWLVVSALALLLLLLAATYDRTYRDAISGYENLGVSNLIYQMHSQAGEKELVMDRYLPSDLSYLTFNPSDMPMKARSWGYYFMLGPDKGFWGDNHALGLGPDSNTYWRSLYSISPPDVILISDDDALAYRERTLRRSQGMDISWMHRAIEQDYGCMRNWMIQVQVRRNLRARFESNGWSALCSDGRSMPGSAGQIEQPDK